MANPNIVNVTDIRGKTAYVTPTNTNATLLLANAASSNKVFKINTIVAANLSTGTNAVDVTVALNTNASGSGTGFPICSTVPVPVDASLVVVSKDNPYYLEEDKSIVVTSGSASNVTFSISYEEIS